MWVRWNLRRTRPFGNNVMSSSSNQTVPTENGGFMEEAAPKIDSLHGQQLEHLKKLTASTQHATELARGASETEWCRHCSRWRYDASWSAQWLFSKMGSRSNLNSWIHYLRRKQFSGLYSWALGFDFAQVFGWNSDPIRAIDRVCSDRLPMTIAWAIVSKLTRIIIAPGSWRNSKLNW